MLVRPVGIAVSRVLPMVIGGLFLGCADDECKSGEDHCDGKNRMTCEQGSCHDPSCLFTPPGARWRVEQCEHACVQPGVQTFCALSTSPEPSCFRGTGSHCQETKLVFCVGEFAGSITDLTGKSHSP